ncbi:MAG: radical SAM protein [Deltaproteobacteria bacterium]|nr:radical SAM protein [Deltaproteobacteria bacterium]
MARSLILFPTSVCDSRCLHCFYYEAVDAPKNRTRLLPADTRKLAVAMGRIKDLSLSGGEPILRHDLEALLEPILRIGRPRSITLPTGGLHAARVERAARFILRMLPETHLTISLSFDGPPEAHDRIRGVPGAYPKQRRRTICSPTSRSPVFSISSSSRRCAR